MKEFEVEQCRCGSRRIAEGKLRQSVRYLDLNGRRRSMRVSVACDRCEACGAQWILERHLRPVHESIVSAMGCVPPSGLRARRREQGMTQRQLAERARVGLRRVSVLERGKGFPTAEEDSRLRAALGLRRRAIPASAS